MAWALQDAKAKFSTLTRKAVSEGPQHVTVRGRPAVVVLSERDFAKLKRGKRRRALVDLFRKSPIAGERLDLSRSKDTGRPVDL
jgi:antitoxin Phd